MSTALLSQVLGALKPTYTDGETAGKMGVFILETRAHPQIPALLRQCRRLLPQWRIVFVHGPEALATCTEDPDLVADIRAGRISCHRIRARTATLDQYNVLMTSAEFYRRLPFEHLLIAQTDSMLCAGAARHMDAFLDYDYVGAPWKWEPSKVGGNGGLSLRRRSKMIAFCAAVPRSPDTPEDVYFCQTGTPVPMRVAPPPIASKFSVESLMTDAPVGTHKPWEYLEDGELKDLSCSCPGLSRLMETNGPRAATRAAGLVEVTSGAAAVPPRAAAAAAPKDRYAAAAARRALTTRRPQRRAASTEARVWACTPEQASEADPRLSATQGAGVATMQVRSLGRATPTLTSARDHPVARTSLEPSLF